MTSLKTKKNNLILILLISFLFLFGFQSTLITEAFDSSQLIKIFTSDSETGDWFGQSVSKSGNTVVVGALGKDNLKGAAYIFERNQGGINNWGEVKKIIASDGRSSDSFGFFVSIDENTVVIGSYNDNNENGSHAGSAYVFERNQGGANNWGQVKKITASDGQSGDTFGISVFVDGDVIVAGASEDSTSKGASYIFERNQGGVNNWGEVKKIIASDGAPYDDFGMAVSLNNNTMIIGAVGDDDKGDRAGSAYIFERNQGGINNWGEVKKIIASDGRSSDSFGFFVSIDENTVVIGSHNDNNENGSHAGSAYVFERNQGGVNNWGEVKKIVASDGAPYDDFGRSVSIEDDVIVVGAHRDDSNLLGTGSAYIFERNQGGVNNWGEKEKVFDPRSAQLDYFGFSVFIDNRTIIIGANQDNARGENVGSAYIYDLGPLDVTPPIITPIINGTLGNNDWYISDVSVNWIVEDPESPVETTLGCEQIDIVNDTAGASFTCMAVSIGGTSTKTVVIKRDVTPPSIVAIRNNLPNVNNWHNNDVTVSYVVEDTVSGIDNILSDLADDIVSTEGIGQSVSGVAVDLAGNLTIVIENDINIDKTKPLVDIITPADGEVFIVGEEISANFDVSDSLSGIETILSTVPNGDKIDTITAGVKSFIVEAIDLAGNHVSFMNHYNVKYVCEIKIDYKDIGCSGLFKIYSLSDYNSYVASDYGRDGGNKYKNIKIMNDLNAEIINIKSPCKITLKDDISFSGSFVNLDGSRGVIDNNSYTINAQTVCVLSEKGNIGLGRNSVVSADNLTILGKNMVKIGFNSTININEHLKIASTGDCMGSHSIVRKGTNINVGGDMDFISNGRSIFSFNTNIFVGGNLRMDAISEKKCILRKGVDINFSSKSGICATILP